MARAKTSVTVDEALLGEARETGGNLSAAAAEGIAARVRDEKRRRPKKELRPTIKALDRYVEGNSLPFEDIRVIWPDAK